MTEAPFLHETRPPSPADPRITVGIPTYNRAPLLGRTVRSVLAQTYRDFRLVIADNASEDDTPDLVASFGDQRIEYFRSERNLGIVGNYNRLIELTESELFMLLPSDDVLYPTYLEAVVDVFARFERVGFVHTAFDRIDDESRVVQEGIRPLKTKTRVSLEPGARYLERAMSARWPICFSSGTYRTEALVDAGGFKPAEEPFSDMPLWMRIAVDWDFAFVAEPLVGFREHEDTVTTAIGSGEDARSDAREQGFSFTELRFHHRTRFLDSANLTPERKRELRALATLQRLAERSAYGAPWAETTRGLEALLRSDPQIVRRPAFWRCVGAHFGGRRFRRGLRA
jgi:glycosyltransferase involved in cell wall biosynthesis